jgi:hypothetical protein
MGVGGNVLFSAVGIYISGTFRDGMSVDADLAPWWLVSDTL